MTIDTKMACFSILCATVLISRVASMDPVIEHSLDLSPGFALSWVISNSTAPNEGTIQFTLEWIAYDWAAIGLHPSPGSGMPDAEVFMCNTDAEEIFCQVRNTLNGYSTPEVDDVQYIELDEKEVLENGSKRAVFTRTVAAVDESPLSVGVNFDSPNGLIFARGAWSGDPMPDGTPLQHDGTAGTTGVNFYDGTVHTPTPAPTQQGGKAAGVWPDRFDSNMTSAPSQPPNPELAVTLFARLRYDFPARSQLWEYFDLDGTFVGSELWVGDVLYSTDSSDPDACYEFDIGFGIIKPEWLTGTAYATTQYLLRQPPPLLTAAAADSSEAPTPLGARAARSGAPYGLSCGPYNYTNSDLFQVENTLGMTNSWVVADSPIAEPIRLEGPDDFANPDFVSILEFYSFFPMQEFDSGTFDIPEACLNQSALPKHHGQTQGGGASFRKGRPSPAIFFNRLSLH